MSSACLVVKQPSFGEAPWSRPLTVSGSPDTNGSQRLLWRPWLSSSRDEPGRCTQTKLSYPSSRPTIPGCFSSDGKPQVFQHPVSDGEALLRNFPIQATISFYDESDSDDDEDDEDGDEEEDWEEDCESNLKQQSDSTSYN
ncbi:protein ripply1 isoform X2 [Thalassophryne amazonica]|uniref:protein ripply1 isoform X2 n=1 Tax=Thalassophryne amazonica TaxID=390379 RepID=UPI0014709C0C|nr:protein ripply1 isoform X2 [Thalassophryne amazonica]